MTYRIKKLKNYLFEKDNLTVRTVRFATLSAIVNAVLALFRIGMGFYIQAPLLCVYGLYHAGIGLAKYTTAQNHTQKEQNKKYKKVGLIVFITCMVYTLYCTKMIVFGIGNISSHNAGMAIIISKFIFVEVGIAIFGVFNTWRIKNLTVLAAKRINLVTALISLVLTVSALLEIRGTPNIARYCGWAGLFVGTVCALIGLHMVFQKAEISTATINEGGKISET